jgi:hypothetical protein
LKYKEILTFERRSPSSARNTRLSRKGGHGRTYSTPAYEKLGLLLSPTPEPF